MSEVRLSRVIEHLSATLRGRGEDDAELLERFVSRRDESAFEALLARHGPMVLGVCRRVLGNDADVEDAFQASFLVLARKAASVRPASQVGNWLYGVAQRTAMQARRLAATRRAKEARAVPKCVDQSGQRDERLGVLDDELARLPRTQREVIVLCDLQGRDRKEVAALLGCAEGTVASRLARARQALARRLARHGPEAGSLLPGIVPAAVPAELARATVQAAVPFALGEAAGAVSDQVISLAEGMISIMFTNRTKLALLLFFMLLAAGAASVASAGKTPPGAEQLPNVVKAPAAKPQKKDRAAEELEKLNGTWISLESGRIWVIAGGRLTAYYGPDHQDRAMTFMIDTAKRPRKITIPGLGFGIYELTGDNLKVWLMLTGGPGGMAGMGPMGGPGMPGTGTGGEGGMVGAPGVFKKEQAELWAFRRYSGKEKLVIAGEIRAVHEQNEALFDEKFADQQMRVCASVTRVRRDGEGYALVSTLHLMSGKGTPLVFRFDKAARGELAKLELGQVVIVQGKCRGWTRVGRLGDGIAFTDCKLVQKKE